LRLLCAVSVILLAGCAGWPPYVGQAEQLFDADRELLTRLAAKIRSSEFVQVSAQLGEIEAWRDLDGPRETASVKNDADWLDLIDHKSFWGVTFDRKSDSVYIITRGNPFFGDSNFSGDAGFLQDVSPEEDSCSKRPPKGTAGACVVHLDSDWFVLYRWWQPK
jgi:hypothetical protein